MKQSLNLTRDYTPTSYEPIEYEFFQFNGGENSIKIKKSDKIGTTVVVITTRFDHQFDIMKVLIAKDALERLGIKRFELVMMYFPYARQDRVCDEGESFSLKVFTDIINSANFEQVTILDPHSDVTPALLNNVKVLSNHEFVGIVLDAEIGITYKNENYYLVSPDAGAHKKVDKLDKYLQSPHGVIKCDKTRNPKTGNITSFEVYATDLKKRDCIIVDDICDGGATFIGLAEELEKKNAGNLYLIVTHGIFSKGLQELSKYFRGIYSTDSVEVEPDVIHSYWGRNFKQLKVII